MYIYIDGGRAGQQRIILNNKMISNNNDTNNSNDNHNHDNVDDNKDSV